MSIGVWAGILLVVELFLILGDKGSLRQSAIVEANRVYEDGLGEGERQTISFDSEKVREESPNHIVEVRWDRIRELVLQPDCMILNAGKCCFFLIRYTVVSGDFDRFVRRCDTGLSSRQATAEAAS